MANVRCYKCGLGADSKCPYCRTVFAEDSELGKLDTLASYRIILSDPKKIAVKLYGDEDHATCMCKLRDFLKDLDDEQVKVVACLHEWEFEPCCGSSCGCGHKSPEGNSPRKFLVDACSYLSRLDGPLEGPAAFDEDDVVACALMARAFDQCGW